MPTAISITLKKTGRTSTATGGKSKADTTVSGPYAGRLAWTKPEAYSRDNAAAGLETRRQRLLFIDDLTAPVENGYIVEATGFRGTITHATKRSESWQCYIDAEVDNL